MTARRFPTRSEIEAGQVQHLRTLLAAIVPENRFYTQRLRDAGIDSAIADLATFTRGLGFTTKAELVADQLAEPPFGSNVTFPIDRYVRFHQTSGTSGAPIRWVDTPESWEWMVGNWTEILLAAGVGRGDRIFFAFSFGPFIGFWMAFDAGLHLGCLCIPGGGMSSTARLRAILDNRCTVICCTPTYAVRLGETACEEGIDLSRSAVRRMIVAGEPGASIPSTRERIERLWPGANVSDHHGMTEVGPVTFECPDRQRVLHVIERAFIAEVIDPETLQPVSPGAQGELVLTNLGRTGSPLFRYRTGDLVQLDDRDPDEPCACGRYDMALVGGILGRTDDMVVVRGVNLHPSAVEAVVRRFDEVAEFRVRLRKYSPMLEVEIDVEAASSCVDPCALADEVHRAMRDAFNLRVPVRLADPGSLPRFEMKARRWVREDEERAHV